MLVSPSEFWKRLARSNNKKDTDVATRFVYPLLGIVAVSAFVGVWWNGTGNVFNLQRALQLTCVNFVAGYAGFFLASFLVDELGAAFWNIPKNIVRSRQFVGYSSIVLFIIAVILNLFPHFFFMYLFLFYVVFIVWEGADTFMKVENENKQKFTILTSGVLIASPLLIRKLLLLMLSNG